MRRSFLFLLLLTLCMTASGAALDHPERLTIPAAASIVGRDPFYSDVRVFNTSYSSPLTVRATYRCFLGACPAVAPQIDIVLAPREAAAYNDMIARTFGAQGSAGGIEFDVTAGGTAADIGVTSRLYSTQPESTVGMFIPGAPSSSAHSVAFLSQIANGGSGMGFRTNVGAFNGQDTEVTATFDVFDGQGAMLGTQARQIPAHAGVQINDIFTAIGRGTEATDNAVVVVQATGDVFSYAAVIDNNTTDPSFVAGAEDKPAPPNFTPPPAPNATPTAPRPTPPPPTPTPTPGSTPGGQTAVVHVGQGGLNFVDQVSGGSSTTIHVGDTVKWVWVGGFHSTTSGSCASGNCQSDGRWDSGEGSGMTFSFTFMQPGTYDYYCTVHLSLMTGVVHVQ